MQHGPNTRIPRLGRSQTVSVLARAHLLRESGLRLTHGAARTDRLGDATLLLQRHNQCMTLLESLRVIAKRWYLVLAGVLALVGASLAIFILVPTNYQASAQVLFVLPSEATGTETPTNPFLNQPQALTTTAALTASVVASDDVRDEFEAAGFSEDYSVAVAPGSGPLLLVTVEDTNGSRAVRTVTELIARVDRELESSQQEVSAPPSQFITTRKIVASQTPQVLAGSKIRAIAAAAAVIVVITVLATFGLERAPSGRHRRDGEGPNDLSPLENDSSIPFDSER